ncbi:MAG: hypothetical protein V4727_04320 [Verrucomicrobiota bacterium]
MAATTEHPELGDAEPPSNEGPAENLLAQTLAKQIQRESKIIDIIEQSACRYFFGETMLVIILRSAALIVCGYLYFRTELASTLGIWPIFALAGFTEAMRANRRLDAMIELESLKNQFANYDVPSSADV